jgi:hypothetical protein
MMLVPITLGNSTMADTSYRPWRSTGESDDVLASEISATWQGLLDESKRCVDALRQAMRDADRRIGVGRRVIHALGERADHRRRSAVHEQLEQRIDAFEQRLAMMEQRLEALKPAGRPLPLPHTLPGARSQAA